MKNYNTETFAEIIGVNFRQIKCSNADSLRKISPGIKLGGRRNQERKADFQENWIEERGVRCRVKQYGCSFLNK